MSIEARRAWMSSSAAALLGAALAGCAAGPNYHEPKPEIPSAFIAAPSVVVATASSASAAAGSPPAASPDLAAWWRALDDKELDSLIDRARVAKADAEVKAARAEAFDRDHAIEVIHQEPPKQDPPKKDPQKEDAPKQEAQTGTAPQESGKQ